jgi:hypothetical protein
VQVAPFMSIHMMTFCPRRPSMAQERATICNWTGSCAYCGPGVLQGLQKFRLGKLPQTLALREKLKMQHFEYTSGWLCIQQYYADEIQSVHRLRVRVYTCLSCNHRPSPTSHRPSKEAGIPA